MATSKPPLTSIADNIKLALLLVWLAFVTTGYSKPRWNYGTDGKACYGTENGMATKSDRSKVIKDLREMYTNCTKVYGNLEVVGITMDDLKKEGLESLDFFENIEEVAGYVLIGYAVLPRLSFPRLRIIWGDKTFTAPTAAGAARWEQFSLSVMSSSLEVLDLSSLRAVVEGRVGLSNASGLCHWKKGAIDWNQILGPGYKKDRVVAKFAQNDTCFNDRDTGTCGGECHYCWGSKAEQCQQIYRTDCAAQCRNNMCYNSSDPAYCCSPECAAGCFGPTEKDCYGCRAMRDDGVCVDKCPAREVYDPRKMEFVHNPNAKYSMMRECVKQCPSHMFVYKEGCVARCPDGYFPNDTICTQCEGPCPKRCPVDKWLSSMNFHEFVNCTVIEGTLEIRPDTVRGGRHFIIESVINFKGLTVEELEQLSSIEEITHYLFVQSETLTTLKFLRNLKRIGGKKQYKDRYSVYITRSDEMKELGLSNLKEISYGEVYVEDNPDLCYVYTLPWANISTSYTYLADNRQPRVCEREGSKCDEFCDSSTGCWGKGPEMCFSCQYYKWNHTCIRECNPSNNVYVDGKYCKPCHDQCAGCVGPDAHDCIVCKNVILGTKCVNECPADYYESPEKKCEQCHENCRGCTGPGSYIGDGGCDRCKYALVHSSNATSCLPEKVLEMQYCGAELGLDNHYLTLSPVHLQPLAEKACLKCHDYCSRCSGYGVLESSPVKCECNTWRLIRKDDHDYGICVSECPLSSYSVSNTCYPCDLHCEECYGPESTQCMKCKDYTDYLDKSGILDFTNHTCARNIQTAAKICDCQPGYTKCAQLRKREDVSGFNCTDQCPPERPFPSDGVCKAVNEAEALTRQNKHTQIIAGVIVAAFFLALIVVCTVLFVWRRRAKALNYMQPPDEIFEMHPEAKPNLARLRLILETQLKKGKILGYGAFGTVFQGIWYPDEKEAKKTKVLVAIKVLHESNPTAQKEMLDEAAIMATMENQYLAQLIGVCVGQQLMLVTPLFPLGNLLEYVQTNRSKIGSLALLRWCTQIATGMSFLEEHRLVHRDLAARNVLVQTPYHIRITDFGLAKMLEYGEEELKIFEGKMPIKWLALECIQYKRYTHKSDVWAYGVTVWELLTFGEKPYKDVPLQQIPLLLEKGDRLPQPRICSLDIYMILIKCWMVDAHTRPSFLDLMEEFSRMMKDPGRFLVVEGDALLRLPSCSSTDRHQLLEQWAELEEEAADTRERGSVHGTNSTPGTPVSPFSPMAHDSNDDIVPSLGECRAASVRQGTRSESISSHRYASDPLKKSRRYTNPQNGKPTVTFEPVATDGDNYLVPDSQQRSSSNDSASPLLHSSASKYTPVIGDGSSMEGDSGMDYYEYLEKAASGDPGDHFQPFTMFGLENKEYMITKNNNIKGSNGDYAAAASTAALVNIGIGDRPHLTDAETVV